MQDGRPEGATGRAIDADTQEASHAGVAPNADAPPDEPVGALPNGERPRRVPVSAELFVLVRQLQSDLRVLIRHVVGRAQKSALESRLALAPGARADGPMVSYLPVKPEFHADLLVLPPEVIAQDGTLLERLYTGVDELTRLAAPADVRSIRLTQAFVQGDNDQGSSLNLAEVKRLQRWAWASALFGLLVFFTAVALLVHVDRGRRSVQQLERVRTEYQAITNDFTVARTAAAPGATNRSGPSECQDPEAGGAKPGIPSRAGDQEQALCGQLHDVQLRTSIVYRELRVWNAISDRLSYASPITWLAPKLAPVAGLSEQQWDSTELRTSIMMTALTGFVLPMLLGLLGACVYVYREIDGQIQTSTLQAGSWVHGALRMLLGAILGGLLGAIWTNGQTIQLEGVSLSLGALAFFVGFSVEVVFRLIDTLVHAVADRISKPAP